MKDRQEQQKQKQEGRTDEALRVTFLDYETTFYKFRFHFTSLFLHLLPISFFLSFCVCLELLSHFVLVSVHISYLCLFLSLFLSFFLFRSLHLPVYFYSGTSAKNVKFKWCFEQSLNWRKRTKRINVSKDKK